jgi:uridylate kinase
LTETAHHHRRVLLKLSGEALSDETGHGPFSLATLLRVAREIGQAIKTGRVELALVIGGGNIFRGLAGGDTLGLARTTADQMGMLATIINSLAMRDVLLGAGVPAEVYSSVSVGGVVNQISIPAVRSALDQGRVVILAGGTGNPFFTTDTAAALRAAEIGADLLYKATKVDGVYSTDPAKDPQALRYENISYSEVLERRLGVMDLTAISFCMENRLPICVFSMLEDGAITKALLGEPCGTIVG